MPNHSLDAFQLSIDQLQDIRHAMAARIERGLAADGEEVRALPAFLPPPKSGLQGQSLVVDLGGTNLRVALVGFFEDGPKIIRGPIKERLKLREQGCTMDRAQFFRMQAELSKQLEPPPGLPVGYCFSYPSETLQNLDARLIRWTKGIEIPGVEGTLVGTGLLDALKAEGLQPNGVCVLNDTVASALAAATLFQAPDPSKVIGLIVGTGTNMAGFFDPSRAPKLKALGLTGPMAVNLESGNFTPPHLNAVDNLVDARSERPGGQRFEKALSGYYLPFLFEAVFPGHPEFNAAQGSGELVRLRDHGKDPNATKLARLLLERSSDLVAAGLTAVMDLYGGTGQVGVLAEGSLFWGDQGYAQRVKTRVDALTNGNRSIHIMQVQDANLLGSAGAALANSAAPHR